MQAQLLRLPRQSVVGRGCKPELAANYCRPSFGAPSSRTVGSTSSKSTPEPRRACARTARSLHAALKSRRRVPVRQASLSAWVNFSALSAASLAILEAVPSFYCRSP